MSYFLAVLLTDGIKCYSSTSVLLIDVDGGMDYSEELGHVKKLTENPELIIISAIVPFAEVPKLYQFIRLVMVCMPSLGLLAVDFYIL